MELSTFSETYIPRFAECDKKYDLKASVLLAWAADTAGNHLRSRGITREQMWQDGQVFLLTKAAINYCKVPVYNEPMNLTTWEWGTKGSQFIRKFAVTDEQGNLLCDMDTMWVLVDPHTHRIYRPSQYIYPVLSVPEDTSAGIEKIHADNLQFVKDYQFVYSDIDANGHVNNGTYLRLMSDILPADLAERSYKTLNVNFVRECMQGEIISLFLERENDTCRVIGKKEDERISFEIEVYLT